MAREVVLIILLLSGCGPGWSVGPGIHCTGPIEAEISEGASLTEAWSARLAEIWDHCAPMIKLNVDSYTGE